MNHSNMTGGIIVLFSAVTRGSADFAGGLASRKQCQFQVPAFAASLASISLGFAMFIHTEPWPGPASILWSVATGISAAIGTATEGRGQDHQPVAQRFTIFQCAYIGCPVRRRARHFGHIPKYKLSLFLEQPQPGRPSIKSIQKTLDQLLSSLRFHGRFHSNPGKTGHLRIQKCF